MPVIQFRATEEIEYELNIEINDELWALIQAEAHPAWVLAELFTDTEGWLANQLSTANCAACGDCSTTSIHAMIGINEREVDYANWDIVTEPGVPAPGQLAFARTYFDQEIS